MSRGDLNSAEFCIKLSVLFLNVLTKHYVGKVDNTNHFSCRVSVFSLPVYCSAVFLKRLVR